MPESDLYKTLTYYVLIYMNNLSQILESNSRYLLQCLAVQYTNHYAEVKSTTLKDCKNPFSTNSQYEIRHDMDTSFHY